MNESLLKQRIDEIIVEYSKTLFQKRYISDPEYIQFSRLYKEELLKKEDKLEYSNIKEKKEIICQNTSFRTKEEIFENFPIEAKQLLFNRC